VREKSTNDEAAVASATVNLASIASTDDVDAPTVAKMIIVMIRGSIRRLAVGTATETTLVSLRLSC
jgi:hypothetical protein